MLCIMLALRKMCNLGMNKGVNMHIVGENEEDLTNTLALAPVHNNNLADIGASGEPDFVNTQAIYARILSQTLAYPLIRSALGELFQEDSRTTSLELVKASDYVPIGQYILFGVVRQMVKIPRKEERAICIGYQNMGGEKLMPPHDDVVCFKAHDSLIVFRRQLLDTEKMDDQYHEITNCC